MVKSHIFQATAFQEKFFFLDADRKKFDNLKWNDEVEIVVRNEAGEVVSIKFLVRRNAYIGKLHCVHGVVASDDGEYRQIEIRLSEGRADLDTIMVYAQAPPIQI